MKKKITKEMQEKVKFQVLRNNKHDAERKSKSLGKEVKVLYPRYKAKAYFNDKIVEFEEHEWGVTYTTIRFNQKIKLPKNRNEYGEDYSSSGGDLIVLRYKLKNKEKIITEIEIIGNRRKRKS
ncbi:MAG: hypothetical protein AABX48_01095 [Nanoarchaeota archaeon]